MIVLHPITIGIKTYQIGDTIDNKKLGNDKGRLIRLGFLEEESKKQQPKTPEQLEAEAKAEAEKGQSNNS